jgi:hypothetical protein
MRNVKRLLAAAGSVALCTAMAFTAYASGSCFVKSSLPCAKSGVNSSCSFNGHSGTVSDAGDSYDQCTSGKPGNTECSGGTDQKCTYKCKTYYNGAYHEDSVEQTIKKDPTLGGSSC